MSKLEDLVPEIANLRTYTDGYGLERIGTDIAGTDGAARASGTGKRKYRTRGERTRQEQWRDAAKLYRLKHMDKVREYQRKYRERKRQANEALQRTP